MAIGQGKSYTKEGTKAAQRSLKRRRKNAEKDRNQPHYSVHRHPGT